MSRRTHQERVRAELERIRLADNRKELRPEAVVDFARDPKTALHENFNWDDAEAGHKYRIWQARTILKMFVTIEPNEQAPIHVYTSLSDSRGLEGGYERTVDVLNSKRRRAKLVQDIVARLDSILELRAMKEFAAVARAIDAVKKKFE